MKKRLLVLLLCASMVVPTNAFADTVSDNGVSENAIEDLDEVEIEDAVSDDEAKAEDEDVIVSSNDTTAEDVADNDETVSVDKVSDDIDTVSDDAVSENAISENEVSANTVSDDSISENEVAIEEVSENEIVAEGAGGTSIGSAAWLSLNGEVEDYLPTTSPYDRWYKIQVPSNGVLSLSFRHAAPISGYYYAEIYNAGQYRMYRFGSWSGSDAERKNTAVVGMNPGVYYIRVYNGGTGSSNKYRLGVWYGARANWETESNNTFATADPMNLNTTMGGNHVYHYLNGYSSSDVDYYKVYVNKTGKYHIQSSHASGTGTTYFSLYTSGMQCLLNSNSFYSSDTQYTSGPVHLTKGYYYIAVSGYSSEYYFKLAKWNGVPKPKIKKVKRGYWYSSYYGYYYYSYYTNNQYAHITWNPVPGASHYQIQMCQRKSFKSSKKWSTTGYDSSGYVNFCPGYYSSHRRKWYVRMRTIMYYNGRYYASKWSKVKSVKINRKSSW